ncbi:hypothetical protein I4U23_009642 [Adineta vaga]|nr:hypothetical protein I4U23_009642 [Adineta vaga]
MAAKTDPSSTTNLASVLLIKRKMAAKDNGNTGATQNSVQPTSNFIGAHSNEKINYRQDAIVANTTTAAHVPPTEQPKQTRKTKQLEVSQLDKKLEEINRKQEAKTNETLDTWKNFDNVNYGLGSQGEKRNDTPIQSKPVKQRSTTPEPEKQTSSSNKNPEEPTTKPVKQQPTEKSRPSTPKKTVTKRADTPEKDQPRAKSPLKDEKPRKESPVEQKKTEKQSSPPPQKKPVDKKPTSPSPQKKSTSPLPREKTVEKQSSPPTPTPRRKSTTKRPTTPLSQQKSIETKASSPPPRKRTAEKQPSPPPSQRKVLEKQPSTHLPPSAEKITDRKLSQSPQQQSIERQPPSPPPRRSKLTSASSLKRTRSIDQVQRKSEPATTRPTPTTEDVILFPTIMSNPQILPTNVQPFEPTYTTPNFRLFPNIKSKEITVTRNACKSIQRSMDRYRFHVW